jgi:protein transport protein SEC23
MYVFFIENKQSFVCYVQLQRVVSYDLFLSYSGIFEINCSKDIKVQGIIGPCASLEKKGPLCSDTAIGQGHTSAWKMCGLDNNTSICLVFEIAKIDTADVVLQSQSNQFYFQFLT